MFTEFEELGLIDRYESVIASMGYEHIEALVLDVHAPVGKHDVGCVKVVDVGQGGSVIYASGLRRVGLFFLRFLGIVDESVCIVLAEGTRSMLQGVGSRFDFRIDKALCDLRCFSFFIVQTQCTH